MKVLVTGGAGFIGSHTCKALKAAGHEPVVFDNLRSGHRWAVKFGPFEHGDILETERLVTIMLEHGIDAVMHFAALAYVGESIKHPDIYYRTNVQGTLSLLNAMRTAGVNSIIFSSTCATFGNISHVITEHDRQEPINPYGASKLMAERILKDYAASYGIGSIALRYFNAAGSDPDGDIGEVHEPETHLIPLVLFAAGGLRTSISVFGTDYATNDGTCIRDYIHVCDLADAHVKALNALEASQFKAFNLGNGNGFSVREVIERAQIVTGRRIPWEAAPARPGDPPCLVADATLARENLGWEPGYPSLDEMLLHAWKFLCRRKDLL